MNKNCCIIITGELRSFKEKINQHHLLNVLLKTKEKYSKILLVCILNVIEPNDISILKCFCHENNVNNIIINYNTEIYKDELMKILLEKSLNDKYIKIKNEYLNTESNNKAKNEINITNIDDYLFISSIQFHQLKIGIYNMYKYERNNNIIFDVIMRTRYDAYYPDLFYPKVYDDNENIIKKVFYNNININFYNEISKNLKINNINSLLNFLMEKKIILPEERINYNLVNISLGGTYYYNSLSLKNIIDGDNNILYSFNDWFYFGKRSVFLNLYLFVDECFLIDNYQDLNIHHIYAAEAQLIMFCVKKNIQIIMYHENTLSCCNYKSSFGIIR